MLTHTRIRNIKRFTMLTINSLIVAFFLNNKFTTQQKKFIIAFPRYHTRKRINMRYM